MTNFYQLLRLVEAAHAPLTAQAWARKETAQAAQCVSFLDLKPRAQRVYIEPHSHNTRQVAIGPNAGIMSAFVEWGYPWPQLLNDPNIPYMLDFIEDSSLQNSYDLINQLREEASVQTADKPALRDLIEWAVYFGFRQGSVQAVARLIQQDSNLRLQLHEATAKAIRQYGSREVSPDQIQLTFDEKLSESMLNYPNDRMEDNWLRLAASARYRYRVTDRQERPRTQPRRAERRVAAQQRAFNRRQEREDERRAQEFSNDPDE